MVSLASLPRDARVLEPASGAGVFLGSLRKAGYKNIVGLEVDETLASPYDVRRESFVSAAFDAKYDLVVGNPPYVRWKHLAQWQKDELNASPLWHGYFTNLSDYLYIFILKSVELLEEGGELIFITPEYWFHALHARPLRDYLASHGYMDEVYRFGETPIFSKVASSIVIFKYVKTTSTQQMNTRVRVYNYSSKKRLTPDDLHSLKNSDICEQFTIRQFSKGQDWILAPELICNELAAYEHKCRINIEAYHPLAHLQEAGSDYVRLGDIADIANGLVSGLDKVFQVSDDVALTQQEQAATLTVMKAKDMYAYRAERTRRYLYLNEMGLNEHALRRDYPVFYKQLKMYKEVLQDRYSYGREIPYWNWTFPRSMRLFRRTTPKIFVPCKERITNKDRLRFSYAAPAIYPTQDVTAIYVHDHVREDLYYILALLNSKVVYDWVRYRGLVRGGVAEFSERPLAAIPIRLINWGDPGEVALHDEIAGRVSMYVQGEVDTVSVEELVNKLL